MSVGRLTPAAILHEVRRETNVRAAECERRMLEIMVELTGLVGFTETMRRMTQIEQAAAKQSSAPMTWIR